MDTLSNQIEQLTQRVTQLEQELAEIKNLKIEIAPFSLHSTTRIKENKKKKKDLTNYPKHGSKWKTQEDMQLIDELQERKEFKEIATIHQRTKGGIHARVNRIIRSEQHKGKTKEEIAAELCLDIDYVEKTINRKYSTEINEFNIIDIHQKL